MPVVDVSRAGARLPMLSSPEPAIRVLRLDPGDGDVAAGQALLTDEERAHAHRGAPSVCRRRILLRAGLRRLVGDVLGIDPARVPLEVGPHGRPELGVAGADVSCSRSGETGLVALSLGHRVGVDIERVEPWRDAILDERWLTPAEQARLRSLEPERRAVAVTRCWTRKEAVLKGIGTGLLGAPADLHVGIGEQPVRVDGWHVAPVPVPGGLLASIATRPLVPVAGPAAERSPAHESP